MTPFASGPQFVKRATAPHAFLFPPGVLAWLPKECVSNFRLHLGAMWLPSSTHTLVWSQKESEWIEERSQRTSSFIHWCWWGFVNQGWRISKKAKINHSSAWDLFKNVYILNSILALSGFYWHGKFANVRTFDINPRQTAGCPPWCALLA